METIPESTPGSNPKEEVLPPKIEDKTPVTEKSSELVDIKIETLDTATHPSKDEPQTALQKDEPQTSVQPIEEIKLSVVSQLIKTTLGEKIAQKDFVEMDEKTIQIIMDIIDMKHDYFDEFQKLITVILEDGKINISDLPHLTSLISLLYETIMNLKKHKLNKDGLIKVTVLISCHVVKILVKNKVIDIKNIDEEKVLESFNILVGSCINLIKLNDSIKGKKSCISRIFG